MANEEEAQLRGSADRPFEFAGAIVTAVSNICRSMYGEFVVVRQVGGGSRGVGGRSGCFAD